MIVEIVSMVNLIAIVILFILFFTKNNKENFTGVPPSYTNLLVSDSDGNLDTFSLTTLETDIDKKIDTKISDAVNSLDTQIRQIHQKFENYATNASLTNVVRKGAPINIRYGGRIGQAGCRTLMGSADGNTIVANHGANGGNCPFIPGEGPDGNPEWIREWTII
jgi:hypothetical protein